MGMSDILDLLKALGGLGINANKLAGVVYPFAFYLYYTFHLDKNGLISRLISALTFLLLIIITLGYLWKKGELAFDLMEEVWENGDKLDQAGGAILWVVMIVFFVF